MDENKTTATKQPDGFFALMASCGGRAAVGAAEATAVSAAAVVSFAYTAIAVGELTFGSIVDQCDSDTAKKLRQLHNTSMERVLG